MNVELSLVPKRRPSYDVFKSKTKPVAQFHTRFYAKTMDCFHIAKNTCYCQSNCSYQWYLLHLLLLLQLIANICGFPKPSDRICDQHKGKLCFVFSLTTTLGISPFTVDSRKTVWAVWSLSFRLTGITLPYSGHIIWNYGMFNSINFNFIYILPN